MTSSSPQGATLLSILIPVYNENAKIESVLESVLKAPLPSGLAREIIVVNDGSTDGTAEILERFKTQIHIHHSIPNHGKGWAIRKGLESAHGDLIVIQDADNEYDPNQLHLVIEPILNGTANVVYGSRFRGTISGMKWPHLVVNKLLVWMVRWLYDQKITDEATAYKAFRSRVIQSIPLECRRFEFCPEVTAKLSRLGEKIYEVPIDYKARNIKEGKKIRWTDAVQAFWTLLRYRNWKPQTRSI